MKKVLKTNVTKELNDVQTKKLSKIQVDLYENKCAKLKRKFRDFFKKIMNYVNQIIYINIWTNKVLSKKL